jgi:hypothetical protein
VSETLQDVKLDISDVQLRMSPDVMALIMHQLEVRLCGCVCVCVCAREWVCLSMCDCVMSV